VAVDVPLPLGFLGDEDTPELRESLVNLFNSQNTLLKTPGVDSFTTGNGACRGAIDFDDEHYQVSGTDLIRIREDGSKIVIGTIPGTADCVMAVSFIALEIIVKGGGGFSLSSAGVLSSIGGSFQSSVDVVTINQRFVFVPADGGPLFFTDVNVPTTIPAANFFDAEFLPDRNIGAINLKNDFYVGGEDGFEIFRDIGPTNNPFLRVDGGAIETGYVAAKAFYKNSFVFLGHDRDGSYGFHIMSAGSAPKISNPAVEELLADEYTLRELGTCTSQRITWKGVDMVAFRLPRHTLLYYGTGWSFMQSGIDPADELQPWDIKFVAVSYGKYITGNAADNKIGIISNAVTEFGNAIERQIDTFIKADPDSYFPIDNIILSCLTGTSKTEGTIGLEISKDNLTFGPQIFRSLAKQGKSQQQVRWDGGGGVFESFAGLRLRTTADINFSMDGLKVNG